MVSQNNFSYDTQKRGESRRRGGEIVDKKDTPPNEV